MNDPYVLPYNIRIATKTDYEIDPCELFEDLEEAIGHAEWSHPLEGDRINTRVIDSDTGEVVFEIGTPYADLVNF